MNAKKHDHREPGCARRGIAASLAVAGFAATVLGGCSLFSDGARFGAERSREPIVRPLPLTTHGSENAQAYYALGKYYFFQGSFGRAEQAYQHAVQLDPNDPEARNGLGVLYDRLGRYDEAQAAYRAALEKAPDAPHILANLGYSLLLQGQSSEAVAPLRRALQLDPDNGLTRTHLAQAEAATGPSAMASTIPVPGVVSINVTPLPAAAAVAQDLKALLDPSAAVPRTILQPGPRRFVRGIIGDRIAVTTDGPAIAAPAPAPMVASVQGAEHRATVSISAAFEGLRIEVSNGNGVTGMARALRSQFREQGLNVTRVTNALPFAQRDTVVVCEAALRKRVAQLGSALPVTPRIVTGSTARRNVDVRVILGADSVPAGGRSREPQRLSMLDD